jgi:hypothetical protein
MVAADDVISSEEEESIGADRAVAADMFTDGLLDNQ